MKKSTALNRLSAQLLVLWMGSHVAGICSAEIYRWTDENGRVYFSGQPPVKQKYESVEVRVNTYESVSYDTSLFDTGRKVEMYATSWCGYCKKARRYFRRKGIAFAEYDIERDARAKARYDRMGARGVPVILVGKKRMNGFSEAGFEKIYN
jgi:glutaredoxin